jgi:hypothetical protein
MMAVVEGGGELAKFVRREAQISERLEDGLVVLDIERDRYFGLGGTGAFLWSLLDSPRGAGELADALTSSFQVDRSQALSDVDHWLRDLLRLELIQSV